ncbi:MAG: hypothetical protein ABMA25_27145 [Ilumatobacteraceae bacterium]
MADTLLTSPASVPSGSRSQVVGLRIGVVAIAALAALASACRDETSKPASSATATPATATPAETPVLNGGLLAIGLDELQSSSGMPYVEVVVESGENVTRFAGRATELLVHIPDCVIGQEVSVGLKVPTIGGPDTIDEQVSIVTETCASDRVDLRDGRLVKSD